MDLVVANLDDLRREIAGMFEARVDAGPLSCGVSGGPTALIFLAALRSAQADWSRVTMFTVDERAGVSEAGESTAGVVRRMLAHANGGRGPRLFPMPAWRPDLEAAAAEYDRILDRELGGEPLDLAILGVGEDGHVAGLFAGHAALTEQTRVVAVHDAPRPPHRRLTVSLPFLVSTAEVWVMAVGPRKRAVVQAAASGVPGETPVSLLVRHAPRVTVFTDQAVHRS